jgi:hypothetical protein
MSTIAPARCVRMVGKTALVTLMAPKKLVSICARSSMASPEYLATHGEPVKLADLSTQNCIGFRLLGSGSLYEWDVTDALLAGIG